MTTQPAPLLELKGISKNYRGSLALDAVDFHIGKAEIIGLLGDNGAGKSTLINILSGIVPMDRGQILRDGRPVSIRSHRDAEKLGIETIYQHIALVDSMTIARNMFLGREPRNPLGFLRLAEMRNKADQILRHTVEISGVESPDLLVGELSGGQRQAVAIARAVHFRKDILLLDEPTSALSVRETESLLEYIRTLRAEGVSSVLVTHNIFHAYRICDRFTVLSHGRKILDVDRESTSIDELTRVVIEG